MAPATHRTEGAPRPFGPHGPAFRDSIEGVTRRQRDQSPREVLEDLMDECRVPRERREEYVRRISRAVLLEIATALRIASSDRS